MVEPSATPGPFRQTTWVTRVLAPLALIVVVIAVVVVVNSSMGDDSTTAGTDGSAATTTKDGSGKKDGPTTPKTYIVAAGDSLSAIAIKFGVSVDRLERLNPDVDPNALAAGTELKIR